MYLVFCSRVSLVSQRLSYVLAKTFPAFKSSKSKGIICATADATIQTIRWGKILAINLSFFTTRVARPFFFPLSKLLFKFAAKKEWRSREGKEGEIIFERAS